jgi:hypothetical protein
MNKLNPLLVCLVIAGAFLVNAGDSYRVTLFQDSYVGDKMLKPGEYTLTVDDNQVIFRNRKTSIAAAATKETGDQKFDSTTVRYQNGDGKYRVREIRLGGTNTKVVFN